MAKSCFDEDKIPECYININIKHSCSTTQKGLEPSTSGVTGRRSNQLSYWAGLVCYIWDYNLSICECQEVFLLSFGVKFYLFALINVKTL